MENAFENQMKSFASELEDVVDENENGNLENAEKNEIAIRVSLLLFSCNLNMIVHNAYQFAFRFKNLLLEE